MRSHHDESESAEEGRAGGVAAAAAAAAVALRFATKNPMRRPQEEQNRPCASREPQFVQEIQL